MKVRLFRAMLFVIAAFLAGSVFLAGRRSPKASRFVVMAFLLMVSGILLVVIGKIALLLAVITLATLFFSSKKT